MSPNPVRLVHFSDIHITARPLGWQRGDWFTKRLPGWINYQLGRKFRFRQAEVVLAALVADLQRHPPDRVVFSGDATALGFEAEFQRAAELLGVAGPNALPGLAVPGNHDYYTPEAAASGLFERYFAPWQVGERLGDAVYPFAQRAGPVWLVGVNSCTGNRLAWDAAGSVDAPQLERLRTLLGRLAPGPRILVTHYPVCLAGGQPERRSHGLRNLAQLVDVAVAGGVGLWLHGHRHHAYHLPHPGLAPFPIICTGSATQSGLWSYHDYLIEGSRFQVTRRVFVPGENSFRKEGTFELTLQGENI
ncbi:MAG: metallophosphoesterase [Planctomycetes bacterium]|nr:metallophosphoesterase [Planctomycetota bacterium]